MRYGGEHPFPLPILQRHPLAGGTVSGGWDLRETMKHVSVNPFYKEDGL